MSENWVPVVAILGSFLVAIVSMWAGVRRREMAHRERLAMIERGLVPAAELEPKPSPHRSLRAGVLLMALGAGLAVLIGLASKGENVWEGLGVGSLLFLLGAAFAVNGVIERRGEKPAPGAGSDVKTMERDG